MAIAALGGLLGAFLLDEPWWGISVGFALVLVRHLFYLSALRAWAEQPRRTELPEATGTWGTLYRELMELQRRNRKRKKRLASMLAQFQASTQALPDGVVALEASGSIAWFNVTAQSLLGLRPRQDIGVRLPNLLRHPDFTEYYERGDYSAEVEIPSPVNPKVMLALRIAPYGGDQSLLLVRDVSHMYRIDRIRRDFVANASHELRTPLTVLRGYLEMMQPETREGGSLAEWRAPLAEMHAQATRMEALLRDLLKLARLEADGSQANQDGIDVGDLIKRAVDEAMGRSAGRHSFEVDVDHDLMLFGRSTEIESVISNLVGNAVQYTPEGGCITITWRPEGDGAVFEVADEGIGIGPDDIPRLTERFYRVDEARSQASGGTGLGLSIVKHALERHEGELEIQSTLGSGSSFTCHFPAQRVLRRTEMAANG